MELRINHFQVLKYRKSSIKPPDGLIYLKHIWGGGGGGGVLKIDVAGNWEGDIHKELK